MAPQTLDQSEGGKVWGPYWIDQSNYGKGMMGLIGKLPASRSLHKLRLRLCREWG